MELTDCILIIVILCSIISALTGSRNLRKLLYAIIHTAVLNVFINFEASESKHIVVIFSPCSEYCVTIGYYQLFLVHKLFC